MYKNILVPVALDDDNARAREAIEIAKVLATDDAKITIFHVIESVPSYAISYIPSDLLAETRAGIHAEINAMAEKLPNAEGVVVDGHSGRTILDWATEHKNDLIVVASHRPGMQSLLLGSTASQVVRHANCAVHVLR